MPVGPWPLPPNSGPSHPACLRESRELQAGNPGPGLFHAPDRWPAMLVMPVGRARPGWRGTTRRLARRPQAPGGPVRVTRGLPRMPHAACFPVAISRKPQAGCLLKWPPKGRFSAAYIVLSKGRILLDLLFIEPGPPT
jgi:hypothetical protein